MGMTPEGFVKNDIKKLLKKYQAHVWYNMPVPSGYGVSTVDFIGHCCGRFFIVETKAEGKEPTQLQLNMMNDSDSKGGISFTVIGRNSPQLKALEDWIITTILASGHQLQ
jgi:hypothetical protein